MWPRLSSKRKRAAMAARYLRGNEMNTFRVCATRAMAIAIATTFLIAGNAYAQSVAEFYKGDGLSFPV